jgi:hypothetical protein
MRTRLAAVLAVAAGLAALVGAPAATAAAPFLHTVIAGGKPMPASAVQAVNLAGGKPMPAVQDRR